MSIALTMNRNIHQRSGFFTSGDDARASWHWRHPGLAPNDDLRRMWLSLQLGSLGILLKLYELYGVEGQRNEWEVVVAYFSVVSLNVPESTEENH